MGLINLRQFLQRLRELEEIVEIHQEVDPYLEIAEIHRRVAAADGPALWFHHVKGSRFPVVTNLFGSSARIAAAFPDHPEKTVASLVSLLKGPFPPKIARLWQERRAVQSLFSLGTRLIESGAVKEGLISPPDLDQLPLLTCWPEDGGAFITLPLVYTEPPGGGAPNLGMYRVQRYNRYQAGLHFQIQKGGGFHFSQAERLQRPLPVHIFIGGPPALLLSAIAPLPENVSELLLAGFLQGEKLALTHPSSLAYPLIAECEFALIGHAPPHERHPEGPFGDHYGYYSLQHDFPLFNCSQIYHRKGAIYPATVVGRPKQEDFYIGCYLQELLAPLISLVMPTVEALWSYGETGFHSLAAAVIKERYARECMTSAFRILGEGQLALTKFLLLTDQPVSLRAFKTVLQAVLERCHLETDLFIFSHLCYDTLDYTGPALNLGSRGVLVGVGAKKRDLPSTFSSPSALPNQVRKIAPFCPGCLVLEGGSMEDKERELTQLCGHSAFTDWPLLVLVDDLENTLKSEKHFLWTVFTRFEPAADLYSATRSIYRNQVSRKGPLLIDARMKLHYPPVVRSNPEVADRVAARWKNYFPDTGKRRVEMGDSDS